MSYFQVRTVSIREGIDQTPCRFDLFKHPVGFLSETISQKHADCPGGHDEGHDHNGTEDLDVFFFKSEETKDLAGTTQHTTTITHYYPLKLQQQELPFQILF